MVKNGEIKLSEEACICKIGASGITFAHLWANVFEHDLTSWLYLFHVTPQETISIAAGLSGGEIQDFVFAFQDRIKNFDITYAIIGDLFHLVNPSEEKQVYEVMKDEKMEADLKSMDDLKEDDPQVEHARVPGLHLLTMLKKHVAESDRKRPGQPGKGGMFSWGS